MNIQVDPEERPEPDRESINFVAGECEHKGFTPDLTLDYLEKAGASLDAVLGWAQAYYMRSRETDSTHPVFEDPKASAQLLVFGFSSRWAALQPEIHALGAELYRQLLIRDPGYVQAIHRSLPANSFKRFRNRVLRRLGMPLSLAHALKTHRLPFPDQKDVLEWVSTGRPLVGFGVLLEKFESAAPAWGHFQVPSLTLRDGKGPELLSWSSNPVCFSRKLPVAELRLERVSGVRVIQVDHFGLSPADLNGRAEGRIILEGCPDLERLEGAFLDLHVEDCPNLKEVRLGNGTRSITVRNCPNVRAIEGWDSPEAEAIPLGEDRLFQVEAMTIEACKGFRRLPSRLRVVRDFHLTESGPIERWPWDLHVGGDCRIADCPGLDELPVLEVMGSLRILGFSRLRRLQPGTTIHGDLDLRACDGLEELPEGLIVVGGTLYPEHLAGQPKPPKFRGHDPLEDESSSQVVLEAQLRPLLLGMRFRHLVPTAERGRVDMEALEAVKSLRTLLFGKSYLEELVLWIAEGVWNDLAEAACSQAKPWLESDQAPDDELPRAWFMNLIDPMRSNSYDRE